MPDIEPPEVPPLLNPSTAIPCANVSKDCLPCDDDPIANFTAEGPDSDRFLFIFRAHVIPPLGVVPGDVDRPGICYSETSQQDAEDCARQDAEEALVDQPVYRNVSIFHNTVQSCTGTCKDGTPFTYTVPAGTVVAFTQLEADQRAMGLACQRARTNRVCILTTALNTGCTGSAYSMTLKGLGGTPFVVSWYTLPFFDECIGEIEIGSEFPYVWFITHGELPDGLTLHSCSGVIDGTPTEIGDFPITLRATDATGAYLEKNFTLRVAEITNDSPLADGAVNAAYLVNFSTSIGDQEQQTWSVVAGSMPPGLTLSATGILSGTPNTGGTFNFTVQVVESGSTGFTCQKPFEIEVTTIPTPTAYYKLDTYPGSVPDSVSGLNLLPLFGAPNVVAAKIDDGYQAPGVFTAALADAAFDTNAKDVTLRAWHSRTSTGSGTFFDILGAGSRFIALYDTSTGTDLRYGMIISDNLGNSAFVESGPVTMGDFHHVVGYVRHGVEIGLIVDNGTPVTTPFLFEVGVTTTLRMSCAALPAAPIIDELSIWNGVVLSTAEITTDWNSGNGRTFPF